MSQWVAISWDSEQILIVSAKGKKGGPVFDRAVRVALDSSKVKNIGEKLRHFVNSEKLAKTDTVVVLGRNAVELRSLSFPPVPDDEIPEMAKFIAGKEFSEFDPTLPFDIFILPELEKGKKSILAATLNRTKLAEIQEVCTGAGLNLKRIVLGSLETPQLIAKNHLFAQGSTQLLLEFAGKIGTFSVLYQGQPVYVRSISFDSEQQDEKNLTSEIKKTIFSGLQHLPNEKITQILVSNEDDSLKNLLSNISNTLSIPVKMVFPWENVVRVGEIKKQLPSKAEVFGPLLGSLNAAFANRPNQLDFLNPKRRKEKVQQRRLAIIAIVLTAILFVLFLGYGYHRRTTFVRQIKVRQDIFDKRQLEVQKIELKKRQADVIGNWKKNQIFWLQELEWLSSKVPTSEETLLTSLQLRTYNGVGEMKFQGNAKSDKVIPVMESSLPDESHKLRSHKTTEIQNAQGYPYTFDMTVTLTPTLAQTSLKKQSPTEKEEEKK